MKRFSRSLAVALVAILAVALAVPALASEKPAFKTYPNIVDAAFVKEVVDGKVKGYIFDARPYKKKYVKGHIPGAVNLPTTYFDQKKNLLPADKSALVVFYCGGLKCALSHKNAYKAQALGYNNIVVFAKGYPNWKKAYGAGVTGPNPTAVAAKPAFKTFPVIVEAAFVKDVVDGKKVGLVIDARPKKKKYDKGHIPGSLSMPTSQFGKLKGLLPADKSALIVFYCGGLKCALSHKAAFKAQAMGYKNVKVFAKGYPNWKKTYGAGAMGVAKAAAPKKAAKGSLKPGKEEGSVDLVYFQKTYKKSPQSIYLVDVRDPGEYKAGAIKGSVNIPVDKLAASIGKLPKDKPVVFVCGTGARSGEAYYMIKDLAPKMSDVYYIDGETTFNSDGTYKVGPPK
ncbi:MAG: rhodanese-like domain-containing protein [Desulfarculaceae bacterium]|nr:rhodanese-like domain-containing protein [Desulfarculaceae bacterium]MCF8073003.1 rhodanese-like domain-containing protein [Desulfarculaceae bacterium]MCF8100701.1 rhodanese-like domain-containing protein [Desulfarculaceae bacterium]MCF8115439.1 rhodanese-like domain-containing protein [Desulfarculaceae bacterium]